MIKLLPISKMILCCSILVLWGSIPNAAIGQNQQELDRISLAAFEKADKKLANVYGQVCKNLEPVTLKKLKASEKAWLIYRDAESEFEASAAAEGGSLYPQVRNSVDADLTIKRIKQLKAAESGAG